MQKQLSPWHYVPSVYFAEGLPYIIINSLSVALYSSLGISNDVFAFWTSWLYLPWVLKMFWSPFVDGYATKRKWILGMQLLLSGVFLYVAFSLSLSSFFIASLAGFFAGALMSATHDIAIDGFYMIALDTKDQAFFVGIRTLFYRLAMISGAGMLPVLAGYVQKRSGSLQTGWITAFCAAGLLFALMWLWHSFALPRPQGDKPSEQAKESSLKNFNAAFKSFFTQKNVLAILAFILLYRVGEATLEKITTPFFIRPIAEGALGLSLEQFGIVKGTVGMIAVILGNIYGGILLSKHGFKKCIWPFALALNIPNLVYLYMAYAHPTLPVITVLLALEQFGYGLGFMAFTVFVMRICAGEYKTSHYAIATGIMALGMMIPGMLSGAVQVAVGYKMFYWIVAAVSLPGLFTIPFILKTPVLNQGK